MQEGAQFAGAVGAEYRLEPRLGTRPPVDCCAKPFGAGLGQAQLLAAAVGVSPRDRDEAVSGPPVSFAAVRALVPLLAA